MDKLPSSARQVDCRTISCSLCFRIIVGESGLSQLTVLPISITAGSLPQVTYLAQKCIPSRGTRRAAFGFQGTGDCRTCWTDIWSNISPGQRCVVTNKPRSWSLNRADCGSHSGPTGASSISRMANSAPRTQPQMDWVRGMYLVYC